MPLKFFLLIFLLNCSINLRSQPSADFLSTQRTFGRVNQAYLKWYDSLAVQCEKKGIHFPFQQIYLRSFKIDNILEVWVKDESSQKFKFLKSYNVCAAAGKLGPKRKEGDKQVPEGFYIIDRFNPNSNYHLSLGVSYPNVSDRILSDAVKPGGDIYIHGDCVSVGCLAINNEQIEEVYILGSIAKNAGQEYIPVHIFPGMFNNSKSKAAISNMLKDNNEYAPFSKAMQNVFYYFEKERELPMIFVNTKGQYIVEDVEVPVELMNIEPKLVPKYNIYKIRKYAANEIAGYVDKQPVFQDGNANYLSFVNNLSKQLTNFLLKNQAKTYVYVDYVVNVDGTVTNVNITKGGNEELNDHLIKALENTGNWAPATRNQSPVAYKMTQTFFIER